MLPLSLLEEIAALVRAGGVIAYPTETFYGLGCDPWNTHAVQRIFRLKGRPEDKPLPLLLPPGDPARFGISIPPLAKKLAEQHWPGPLTLVVPATGFPPETTAGTSTVAVRRSPHPFVSALLEILGKPLVTTSANLSGQAAAATGPDVFRMIRGWDCLVDGGHLPGKRGSTIVDCTGDRPKLVREGDLPVDLK